jgi:hypothetical protein
MEGASRRAIRMRETEERGKRKLVIHCEKYERQRNRRQLKEEQRMEKHGDGI